MLNGAIQAGVKRFGIPKENKRHDLSTVLKFSILSVS